MEIVDSNPALDAVKHESNNIPGITHSCSVATRFGAVKKPCSKRTYHQGIRRYLPWASTERRYAGLATRLARIAGVARMRVSQGELVVKLNPVEQFFALRRSVHVPLSWVRDVSVLDRPLDSALVREVKMGFAARTAPARGLICCGPRATWREGQALLVVYGNSRSVVVELGESSPKWRLLLVSVSDPETVTDQITGAQLAH